MLLEQPLLGAPDVARPPLGRDQIGVCLNLGEDLPGVTSGIDGGERHAAVVDLEVGLVLQIKLACKA
jgi:hypothetical protein